MSPLAPARTTGLDVLRWAVGEILVSGTMLATAATRLSRAAVETA